MMQMMMKRKILPELLARSKLERKIYMFSNNCLVKLFISIKEVRSCYFQSYRSLLTSAADHSQYPDMKFQNKIGGHRPSSPTSSTCAEGCAQ